MSSPERVNPDQRSGRPPGVEFGRDAAKQIDDLRHVETSGHAQARRVPDLVASHGQGITVLGHQSRALPVMSRIVA